MAEFSDSPDVAPNMADLLEYFEARSRSLDDEGYPVLDASTLQFISLIRFNGIPILPPVLTESKREEMQTYRHAAVKIESRTRAKRREDMHSKVQSIVAGVERTYSLKSRSELPRTNGVYKLLERRAAKSARKISPCGSSKQSVVKETTSTVTRLSGTKSFTESGKNVPPEVVINVPLSKQSDKPKSSKLSSASPVSGSSKSKSSPSNYKSLGKLGTLNKHKSLSSQHLDRTSTALSQSNQEANNDPSPRHQTTKDLFPHPPAGRPPSRGSTMRQSASTPDLRNIEVNVKTEDLKKPLPSRSLSPKGGRPQTQDKVKDSPKHKDVERKRENDSVGKSSKPKLEKTQKETINKESTYSKKETKIDVDVNKSKLLDSSKPAKDIKTLHNPLETLEKELVKQEEAERSQTQKHTKLDLRQDLDPIQTAAAELFPYPISEEEALATLDSLQADFASLEQMDSLPDDYNGIPLTSSKEKQIIHMLTKLSKALNIEDTLASTTGSNASHVQNRELTQEQGASVSYHKSATIGANKVEQGSGEPSEHVDMYDDGSVNVTNDSSVTGHSSGSGINTSASSRGRMSPTGSSILSPASSVGASRSRMSPKSLKNTVHFSSFVTEISTSASQSYEDKISIRKLDITPKNSENFEEGENPESKNENSSSSGLGPGTSQTSGSLLNKVALSPSIDSPSGSPGDNHGQGFPLDQSGVSQDGELNTSDKENEFTPSLQSSSNDSYQNSRSSSRNPQVLNVYTANIPEGPIGENHPAVVKTSIKSDLSENSTLKGTQEKALTYENLAKYSKLLESQTYYHADIRDLDIYRHGTNSSTSSMQEEITRSYLLQQQRSDRDLPNGRSVGNKQEISSSSSDGVSVVLQPVLPNNFQNSLNENRSMLENEEEIRSNLQRVLLEDSDDDCSEGEIRDDKQKDIVDNYAVRNEHFSDREEKLNEEVLETGIDNDVDDYKKGHIEIETDDDKEVDTAITELIKDQTAEVQVGENDDETQNRVEIKVQDEHKEIEGAEEEEEEGKAEHIQKYLIHVHEQSMQHEDDPGDSDTDDVKADGNFDIASLIQSFTSTLQSMNHLSQEDLFRIQAEQFELLQKKLIEQQRAQLEELFVSQRREQLALEKEIESYQTTMQGYDNIETIPLPDTQRAPLIESIPNVSTAWQYANQVPVQNPHPNPALSPPFRIQPVPTVPYPQNINTSVMSHNTSYSTIPYSDIHTTVPFQHVQGQEHIFQGQQLDPDYSRMSYGVEHGIVPAHKASVPSMAQNKKTDKNPAKVKKRSANPKTVQPKNPYIYPTSPSLCQNPAERDDQSDVSSFVKATPRQLVFSNQSTPVPVPKVSTRQPVMHSPAKKPSQAWAVGKPYIPELVFNPRMKPKFDSVSAAVKGYLTRRLLKTHKVQEIIKTINDTRNFAFSFQAETPIKQGTFSREDRGLLERIVAQLQAALLDIHEIFFLIPVSERMAIISSSRLKEQDQYLRESKRSSVSVSQSQPRLSKATLKALERKKKAQLAEEAVFGSAEFRPKSAPPNTSSPHPSTDIRALRPLQGQISPIRPDSQVIVREIKEKPKSAGDRAKQKTTSSNKDTNKTKKSSGTKSTKSAPGVSQSNKQQKSTTANSRSKKMDKAWR